MKIFLIIILACIFFKVTSGQDQRLLKTALLKKVKGPISYFTTDNTGNIYLLTPNNQLKKQNANGDSIAVYNDVRRFGKIFSIDASNPLKVLVYYKEFSTIVILDRLLNTRGVVDLKKQDILQASAIASSYDNNIWVYDELESRLKKIDDGGKVLFESTDFRQLFDPVPAPGKIFDRDGQIYLYDSSKGLLVFDYYGAKKNQLQLLHVADLQVLDKNSIIGRKNGELTLYKPSTLEQFSFTLENPFDCRQVEFDGNLLYCLTTQGELEISKVVK